MNRKRWLVTTTVVMLMCILFSMQVFFEENFKEAIITDNSYKKCEINTENYTFLLPNDWTISENNRDILEKNSLNFKDDKTHTSGLIEIINTNEDVEKFAKKDLSNQSLKYSNVKFYPYKNGILAEYDTSIPNGYDYKNNCYYIKLEQEKIAKILFNSNKIYWKEENTKIFSNIIERIKANKI